MAHASQVWNQPTKYWPAAPPKPSLDHLKACQRSPFGGPQGPPKSERSGDMGTPVVLITGALTGIGRAAARPFAREGHPPVVPGPHEEAGHTLVPDPPSL